jgi:K+-transporting ATPase ATPase C chain
MSSLSTALRLLLALTALTGLAYPLAITALAQLAFPHQANGSVLQRDGRSVGSRLIGQPFSGPRYFWGRPSATGPLPYHAAASTGSNLGPTNPALLARVEADLARLRAAHPGAPEPVPVDLVTASASGLDPHLSVAGALYQVARVAAARGLDPERLRQLVLTRVEGRFLGLIGEPRVNVLELNLALDDTGAP